MNPKCFVESTFPEQKTDDNESASVCQSRVLKWYVFAKKMYSQGSWIQPFAQKGHVSSEQILDIYSFTCPSITWHQTAPLLQTPFSFPHHQISLRPLFIWPVITLKKKIDAYFILLSAFAFTIIFNIFLICITFIQKPNICIHVSLQICFNKRIMF